jgi:hypothetical protein
MRLGATMDPIGNAEKFATFAIAYPLATMLQLPFQIILAAPWLLLAWLLSWATRGRLAARSSLLLLSGIAAAGLAPVYGYHFSMLPAYLGMIEVILGKADPICTIKYFMLTWAVTWGVFLLIGFGVAWHKARRREPGEE